MAKLASVTMAKLASVTMAKLASVTMAKLASHSSFLWYKIPSRMLGIKLYAVNYGFGQITSTTFIQHYFLKAHKVI